LCCLDRPLKMGMKMNSTKTHRRICLQVGPDFNRLLWVIDEHED
jgi:hypothetical protein